MKRAAFAVFGLFASLALVTLLALEGGEVVVLHTRGDDGAAHSTRTWIAEADGSLWVEAANPERAFYRDIQSHPRVELERGGGTHAYTARAHPGRAGHERIRALLRARYGWADRWIGLLTDTSRSIPVELRRAD